MLKKIFMIIVVFGVTMFLFWGGYTGLLKIEKTGLANDSIEVTESETKLSEVTIVEEFDMLEEQIAMSENEVEEKEPVNPHMDIFAQIAEQMKMFSGDRDKFEESLSSGITIDSYAEGDIGNDGVQDIAMIVKSYMEDTEPEIDYAVMVFSQKEGGYECIALNNCLVGWGDEVRIIDDKLHIYVIGASQDVESCEYVLELENNTFVLRQFVQENTYEHSQQGTRIVYDMSENSVKAYAFSMQNKFEPWILYTAECIGNNVDFSKLERDMCPEINQSSLVYSENGKTYDYHILPMEEYYVMESLEHWQTAYLELIDYMLSEEDEWYPEMLYYGLIYVDEDDIPELVLSQSWHWSSVYTYAPGKTYADINNISVVMDQYGSGAMGITEYLYAYRKNIIYYTDKDAAGNIVYDVYFQINSEKEYEKRYVLCCEYTDSENGVSEPKFYYNGSEITEDEYQSYKLDELDGDWYSIIGTECAYEIINQILEY